jgi:hypothetical protein
MDSIFCMASAQPALVCVSRACSRGVSLIDKIQGLIAKMSDDALRIKIEKAYIELLRISVDGAEASVLLASIGQYEIRICGGTTVRSAVTPLFWLELFDHASKMSIDSCSCHQIEDAIAAFEYLTSQARLLNEAPGADDTETPS